MTSLNQLLFIENIIYCLDKEATLMRRSIIVSFPHQLVFPGLSQNKLILETLNIDF